MLMLLLALVFPLAAAAETPSTLPADPPYRNDASNAQSPWYRLHRGEFPPIGSEHRIGGKLMAADYIHRSGQFKLDGTGELLNFKLPPYGTVRYLHAEADLRDVPLGTHLRFCVYQDAKGAFTQVAAMEEWDPGNPDARTTEELRKKHTAFLKMRGLPALIDHIDGKKMTVTLIGDPASLAALFKDENIDPKQWATEHRRITAAVANEDLRTYNPGVDQQGSDILEFESIPTDRFGCSGVRWTILPSLLLEGFRKGHVIRLFMPGWKVEDMPFGEVLYTEMPGARPEEEDPNQFSYRTDFGNESLAWYQLKPGEFPPFQSQHLVSGELMKIDAAHRNGQFRADISGETVEFTMPPFATVMHLGAEAELGDLPLGSRYLFYLYPDAKGAFTQAAVINDDFTRLANRTIGLRVDSVDLKNGLLFLTNQLAVIKDDKEHLVQPPDLGHGEYAVDEKTKVWKGDKQASLGDIAVGDKLLVAMSGQTPTSRGRCTEIWDGADAIKRATDDQRAKHVAFLKENGAPAWIEIVEGSHITIMFFTGNRRDFNGLLNGDPPNRVVYVTPADDALHPLSEHLDKMDFNAAIPGDDVSGTYDSSGVRWVIGPNSLPPAYHKGGIIRVFEDGWAKKAVSLAR